MTDNPVTAPGPVGGCPGERLLVVCAARTADRIFAKEILYEKLKNNGTPCLRYDDFGNIRRYLGTKR